MYIVNYKNIYNNMYQYTIQAYKIIKATLKHYASSAYIKRRLVQGACSSDATIQSFTPRLSRQRKSWGQLKDSSIS